MLRPLLLRCLPSSSASTRLLSSSRPHLQRAQEEEAGERASSLPSSSSRSREVSEHQAKGELEPKKKRPLYDSSSVPINIGFHNKKLRPGYDPEYELAEVVKDMPEMAKQQAKLLRSELRDMEGTVEKVQMMEDCGSLKNDEARPEYSFHSPEALARWKISSDSDWNEGFSKGELVSTDRNTALFRGEISSRLIKDGRIERAGWSSIKLEERLAFNRKKFMNRWRNFSHLLIKCRGDGRSYKVMLHSPMALDVTWGDSFSHPLHTHGGPYWQYERIPFSKFFHTVAGRIQDRQYPVNLDEVSSLSIVLMDRIDGPFQLEIDWIGVVHDTSHVEEFAYETYTLPLFNTHGF